MLSEMLAERRIPEIPVVSPEEWGKIRAAYREILLREEYGRPVPEPEEEWFEEKPMGYYNRAFCAESANYREVVAHTVVNGKEFSFPFFAIYPKDTTKKYPFFVNNEFMPGLFPKCTPTEEILDNGFAMFLLCYKDVVSDDEARDFTNGLAGVVTPPGERDADPEATGKLCMWAWANSRVLDYALRQPYVMPESAAVIGLSRLGKTALLTGMLDERFRFVVSSGAGCSGDALANGSTGETIRWITDKTRETRAWFCPNYYKYAEELPREFDQHMLLATIAPRTVILGAAENDKGADPLSEFLSGYAASPAWESHGLRGLVCPDRQPQVGDNFDQGGVCYHLRAGGHYQTRFDWHVYMETIRKKLGIPAPLLPF